MINKEKKIKRYLRLEKKRRKRIPPTSMKVRENRENLPERIEMGNISEYLAKTNETISTILKRRLKFIMHNNKYLFLCTKEESLKIAEILEVKSKLK